MTKRITGLVGLVLVFLAGAHAQVTTEDLESELMVPKQVTVNTIFIIGNEKTRKNIILREMDISEGVTYEWEEFVSMLVADQKKIYNLLLFNTVDVKPYFVADDQVEVLVSVTERWYILPSVIFTLADRNFSEWWINQNRDFSRVNYGIKLDHNNVGGRNEKLRLVGQLGFTQAFDIQYSKPYIDRKQLHGISARFNYFTNKTIAVRSSDNRQVFYTNPEEDVLRKSMNALLNYSFRGSYYNFHSATVGYHQSRIHEDVLVQNPVYFPNGNTQLSYFFASYSYRHDKRDNNAYATDGELLVLGVNKYGLFGRDNIDETEFTLQANRYLPLRGRFHLATGLSASTFLSPLQPYTLVRGIGYRPDFIRGYEINVIEGQQVAVHKNSLRYELFNAAFDISNYMPIDEFAVFPFKMYLSANFDHGIVHDRNRLVENLRLTNRYLYGYGVGLDLVTFYDTVIRFEYSINDVGMGNFFINMKAPL
ncbi:surface antigen variable number repeat domain protein [Lunatimonas lonarensis]|uniref:Surface antigen variable number repeat domain protein n=1 Tax=Lunatimonas lonarensis TaxID=1232681 RepID=R7ZPP2_9BACT|nr:BamA/TamA family outer membrane protein [Lunatimonas lonarensis]EON76057.1 surface antigen variable number repeat domain protein [Lunatimonas lonarensis]